MDHVVTIVVAIIGSGAFTTLVSQICHWFNKRSDEQSGVQHGMRLILKDRLRELCIRYIDQGWVYADELEDAIRLHHCYHTELGGNGYLDELMNEVNKLPIRGYKRK